MRNYSNINVKEPKVGQRFRVVGNSNGHNYTNGLIYRVARVDTNDMTLIGIGPNGQESGWIKWGDIQTSKDINWAWLQQNLAPEAVELLTAFEGLSALTLSEDIRNHIVWNTPDLHQRILDAQVDLEREDMNSD